MPKRSEVVMRPDGGPIGRRSFLQSTAAWAGALATWHGLPEFGWSQAPPGEQPRQDPAIELLNPRGRVPLSFIIDDSTCLVNMGHFCMPQFAEAWPEREVYRKPWQTWPREIPDSFVREFGEWCAEHGVRGKYSIVPYPACVGWVDRFLPGWSKRQLDESLQLVRELMVPNWDIHPEMISHTRVIDLATGRPLAAANSATMENSYPQEEKSVDELAAYLAYALQILKNCELPCEGVTTPGGFGNRVKSELSLAVDEAVRDVYGCDVPHYFKYVLSGDESTEPKLEHVRGLGTEHLRFTVNVPAGTGDWFGGWDGDRISEPDRYATSDGTGGRMVELIRRGQPAVMICHWPGMYTQGTKAGFQAFRQVVESLNSHYADETLWMKTSEMARYWAARGLTTIRQEGNSILFDAPVPCPGFTVRIPRRCSAAPSLETSAGRQPDLEEIRQQRDLRSGTWLADDQATVVCFDLPRGASTLAL